MSGALNAWRTAVVEQLKKNGINAAAAGGGVGARRAAEAAAALCTLGYSQSQAAEALAGLAADLPVDELIRQALKKVARL